MRRSNGYQDKKTEGLLAQWALALQEFGFRIVYRKGTQHGNADALSRRTPHCSGVSATTSCVPPSRDELGTSRNVTLTYK